MAFRLFLALFLFGSLFAGEGKIFQVAPFNSLEEGGFGGYYGVGDLKDQGDFGLGALQGLAGELVVYNGDYLYADQKGRIKWLKKQNKVAWAQVSHFKSEYSFRVKNIRNLKILNKVIQDHLKSTNIPAAVLIKGDFVLVQVRTFKPQKKPYSNLKKAISEQNVFHFEHDRGVAVGFWSPSYWSPIMPQNTHLHFLNGTMSRGGHVLDIHIDSAEIFIQPINDVEIYLPDKEGF